MPKNNLTLAKINKYFNCDLAFFQIPNPVIDNIVESLEDDISVAPMFFKDFSYDSLLWWKRAAYELNCLAVAYVIERVEDNLIKEKSRSKELNDKFIEQARARREYEKQYKRVYYKRKKEKERNPNAVPLNSISDEIRNRAENN